MLELKRGLEVSLLEFVNLKLRNEYLVCSPPDFPESDSDKSFPEIQINVIYDPCGNIFFLKRKSVSLFYFIFSEPMFALTIRHILCSGLKASLVNSLS